MKIKFFKQDDFDVDIKRFAKSAKRSEKELPPAGLHVVPPARYDPLVLAQLAVESSLLNRPQFQRESRAHFTQFHLLRVLKLVPKEIAKMTPKTITY